MSTNSTMPSAATTNAVADADSAPSDNIALADNHCNKTNIGV